jgi:bacillithiol system protein YtxJ
MTGWEDLISTTQLAQIEQASFKHPIFVFKHSTRCGTSMFSWNRIKALPANDQHGASFYYLDLLQHRDISNLIAEKWGVRHESPQLLVLNKGQVSAHASHEAVFPLMLDLIQ